MRLVGSHQRIGYILLPWALTKMNSSTARCWLPVITQGLGGSRVETLLRYSCGKLGQAISLTSFRGIPLRALLHMVEIAFMPGRCHRLSSTGFAWDTLPSSSFSLLATHVSETITHRAMGPSVDDGDPFQIRGSITAASHSLYRT